ncbi:hypothetical protein E4K72_18095 [Oxalobacteraceae bacterium OM1]|nr:hypothetical protein E4K72_18095 [Oxalobacteraceae bacterium OM1]
MTIAWRQLQQAVRALDYEGTPRERLVAACYKLVRVRTRDMPAEVARDFEWLMGGLARYPLRHPHDEIKHRIAAFSDEQVQHATRLVWRMHDAVAVYQPRTSLHAMRQTQGLHNATAYS